jgi:hypothetical protein
MSNKARAWISVIMCDVLRSCVLDMDLVLYGRSLCKERCTRLYWRSVGTSHSFIQYSV